jgi:predicted cation transporter
MKTLITVGLIVSATIVLVAVAIIRHVNNKQNAAWCYENGYANYATNDGFCVGAGGKLIKVGINNENVLTFFH